MRHVYEEGKREGALEFTFNPYFESDAVDAFDWAFSAGKVRCFCDGEVLFAGANKIALGNDKSFIG